MRKILIHNSASCFDYSIVSNFKACYKNFYNSGNCLFFFAFEKFLRNHNISYECSTAYSADYINDNFDCVVELRANIFQKDTYYLDYFYKSLIGVKIPIFFLTTGIQAENESDLDSLVDSIGDKSKKLIDLVYASGGEFGLRGNYSKCFFDKLTPNTAEIIGCASFLLADKSLNISNNKVNLENFKPAINGHIKDIKTKYFETIILNNSSLEYLDQDEFGKFLYKNDNENYIQLVRQYSKLGCDLLIKNKVNLFYSVPEWSEYVKDKFNFVFGTRIHGSILAILNKIPALVFCKDLRVKELCDFYSIPYICKENKLSLFELYNGADYSKFNKNFNSKYDLLINFLQKHNIISSSDLQSSANNCSYNIDSAHIQKVNNIVNIPSKNELYVKLFNTYIKYIIYKGVGGGQDQFLDIRTIKYLLGILKV